MNYNLVINGFKEVLKIQMMRLNDTLLIQIFLFVKYFVG